MKTSLSLQRYALSACIALLLICILSCTDTTPRDVTPKISDKGAPDFTLKSLSGQTFKLNSQRGRHVLLIFITSWCPTCRSEIPHYKKIFETYGSKGLEVVMIDVQEPKEVVSRFASRYQIPFPVLLDEKEEVSRAFGIVGVPAMVLIDKDGQVLSRQYMAIDMLLETIFGTK